MPSAFDRRAAQAIVSTVEAIRDRGGNVPSADVQTRAAGLMGMQSSIAHACGVARLIWVQGSERRYPVTLLLERSSQGLDVIDAVCPCEAGEHGQVCYHALAALASACVQDGQKLKV